MDDKSLAHSKYNCTYHLVWIPKYRRKALFGEYRKEMGEIIGRVCKLEGVVKITEYFPAPVRPEESIVPLERKALFRS